MKMIKMMRTIQMNLMNGGFHEEEKEERGKV
jgi:hypothetical protein